MSETSVRRRVDVGRVILVVEGVLLLLLGIGALVAHAPGAAAVLAGFQVNLPHAIALIVVGGLALAVAVTRRLVLPFAVFQFVVAGAAYLYGANIQRQSTGDVWQFNQPDSWLHLAMAVIALVIGFTVAAARGAHSKR